MTSRCETGDEPVHDGQRQPVNWDTVNWDHVKQDVRTMQCRIYQETRAGNFKDVVKTQKLLVKSLPARLLAVRQVTVINTGRNTPGIDGVTCHKSPEKVALVERLRQRDSYKPKPARTVFIPKSSGGTRRLGIPTIEDRAMEALVALAMDPEYEAKFEPNSYGFRPGRSAIDAVKAIANMLVPRKGCRIHPGWVLDADISKCFDSIDHDSLMAKLADSPFRGMIRSWLEAGSISRIGFEESVKGTPQGGVISPLLANIALDGLERAFGIYSKTGRYYSPHSRKGANKDVAVFRYADDFIDLAPSKECIYNHVLPMVKTILATVGLDLNLAKTRVVCITEGFSFLGFRFQRFHRRNGEVRKFVYQPDPERVRKFAQKLAVRIKHSLNVDVKEMIRGLNRQIIGFCNYFRWSDAHRAFGWLSKVLWTLLWRWARRKHPTRGLRWLRNRYWVKKDGSNWVFSWEGVDLVRPNRLGVKWWMYPILRIDTSPYDENATEYWERHRCRIKVFGSGKVSDHVVSPHPSTGQMMVGE